MHWFWLFLHMCIRTITRLSLIRDIIFKSFRVRTVLFFTLQNLTIERYYKFVPYSWLGSKQDGRLLLHDVNLFSKPFVWQQSSCKHQSADKVPTPSCIFPCPSLLLLGNSKFNWKGPSMSMHNEQTASFSFLVK